MEYEERIQGLLESKKKARRVQEPQGCQNRKNRILNERSHDAVVLRLCVLKKLYVSEFFLTIATHLEAYKQSRIRLPA